MNQVRDLFEKGHMASSEYMLPLMHMLMDGISDYIFLMEVTAPRRFKYVLVNQSAKVRHMMPGVQWEGRFIEDLVSEDEAESLINRYQWVLENKVPFTYEDQMDLDGTAFCGHTSLTPLESEDGEVKYILAITRDITETVQKEREFNRINAIYRSLMENTADAILIFNREHQLVEMNEAVKQLYGFTKQEFQNGDFPFVPEDRKEEVYELIRRALDGEEISGFQTERVRKGGDKIDVSMTVSPIQNDEGAIIGVSSIVRDISSVKKNERKLAASRSRYQSLFEHNPHPILTLRLDGSVHKANPASLEMMNTSFDELSGSNLLEWLPEEKAAWVRKHVLAHDVHEDVHIQTTVHVGGDQRTAMLYLVPIMYKEKRVGLYAILDDITEKERAVDALRQSEAKFRLIADNSNDLISVFTPFGGLLYASPSIVDFFGFDPAELAEAELQHTLGNKDLVKVVKAFEECYRTGVSFTIALSLMGRSGQPVWFECKGTPVESDEGRVNRIVIVARDISEQKKYEDKLKRIAFYDYLTGLPNRRLFEDRLEQAMLEADRREKMFALLYLDGDGFKRINDQFGHDMGDDFLKLVGDRMKECLRDSDSIGRIGGDEFAILLKDVETSDQVREIAQRILDELRAPYELNGMDVVSSFSIGISFYPDNGTALDDLFRNADQALYAGKRRGKDQIWLYEDL
ncbi:PAS domain S-box protein [Halobacillus litoralis]|uniref:PAS domain S-box protein n=1 Tax=Halobacillus litoralis TaxID=45668 RepID=UPI001CD57972|nr:PAS domain S-box protein [Halobacillus litoralis]MCA0971614.1 PAS domain S-box protein [Halobacillus litoralis]